jgi:hypothetical protein
MWKAIIKFVMVWPEFTEFEIIVLIFMDGSLPVIDYPIEYTLYSFLWVQETQGLHVYRIDINNSQETIKLLFHRYLLTT